MGLGDYMKNIILVGASRAGKTTLVKKIKDNYQIISGDALRVAYHKAILKDKDISSGDVGKSIEFRNFLMEVFNRYLKYNPELNFVLDTVDIDLESCDLINKYDITVIALGYTLLTPEEVVRIQKENDTEGKDWSFSLSDQERFENAKICIEDSKRYKGICDKLGFKFVDTSFNREEVLEEVCEWIKGN